MWINAKEAGIATRARTQLDKKKKNCSAIQEPVPLPIHEHDRFFFKK